MPMGTSGCSDEALAVMARSGAQSTEAFAELLARTMPIIRARVEANAASAAHVSREDLLQEGMLGFLCAVSAWQPEKGASFRTFASVCVSNRVISALRRSPHACEERLQESDVPPGITAMDPQDVFFAIEESRRIMEHMREALSPLECGVMEGYLAGERYERIARQLGVSAKTVDNALQRVRKKLRIFLENDSFGM